MNAQTQTRRTMSNALALLEDVVESIDGPTKERLSRTIEELEAIENELGGRTTIKMPASQWIQTLESG